jgi:CCR4-NOT transcriptional regulation complex NOT5 subunit
LKDSGEQVDDRIVEVYWDTAGEHWRMMRFRDDKPHGNHRSVVENIIQSIADGVEKDIVSGSSQDLAQCDDPIIAIPLAAIPFSGDKKRMESATRSAYTTATTTTTSTTSGTYKQWAAATTATTAFFPT